MKNFVSVILAAGMGTRMKSETPKVLHKVCGKQLCKWVIDASCEADDVLLVVGHKADMVKEQIGDTVKYALQAEQKGTGHAVMQASDFIGAHNGYVVILNGDTPLVTAETIKQAIEYHESNGNCATVITAKLDNPFGYGRIIRDENKNVKKIVEQKDATDEEKAVDEVNSGMYVFNADKLVYALSKLTPNNAQGEYYLTDTLEILLADGGKVGAFVIADNDEIRGINDRVQLSEAERIMRSRINEKHMRNGVTMSMPETIYIEGDVEIGSDTIIEQNVILKGNTKIGKNAVIGAGSRIDNSIVHDGADILSSVLVDAEVGEGTHVGPFAYMRPNSKVGKNVKVGDFVEIKNSTIDDGTKISHLTYIGDSDVGKNVNFGCGTVTVNYDGKKKYRTTIGDNSFIGCNTNLVSPVTVENGAYIAAGSTITDDVPEKSLAIARARQVVKDNWSDRRD